MLNLVLGEELGEGLNHHLLFPQKLIGKDAGHLLAVFDLHNDTVCQLGDLGINAKDLVQPDERIALAPEHDHLRTVGVGNQLAAVRELEGLLDGGDGQGEDRAAHRQLHAVHNRQGEGDLDGEGGAFPPLGINGI